MLIVLLFVLCLASASALTIETDKDIYNKGETIAISGESDSVVIVAISNGNTEITTAEVLPEAGVFSLDYTPKLTALSGTWTITAESDTESVQKTVQVNLAGEAAYLLITFFSPSEGEHKRGKTLEVNIELTDSGNAISGAEVLLYSPSGESFALKQIGLGRYSGEYVLPFNAELGAFDLVVAAEFGKGDVVVGGENSIALKVVETDILIEILRPSTQNVPLGEPSLLVVNPSYSGGNSIEESARVVAKIGGIETELARQSNGEYQAAFSPQASGDLLLEISAVDSAGNKGQRIMSLIVGSQLEFILRTYWPVLLLIVIVFVLVIYKVQSRAVHGVRMNSLSKKRQMCKIRLKKLQENYYTKGAMDKASFETAASDCKRELTEIDARISSLKKNKKEKK